MVHRLLHGGVVAIVIGRGLVTVQKLAEVLHARHGGLYIAHHSVQLLEFQLSKLFKALIFKLWRIELVFILLHLVVFHLLDDALLHQIVLDGANLRHLQVGLAQNLALGQRLFLQQTDNLLILSLGGPSAVDK